MTNNDEHHDQIAEIASMQFVGRLWFCSLRMLDPKFGGISGSFRLPKRSTRYTSLGIACIVCGRVFQFLVFSLRVG